MRSLSSDLLLRAWEKGARLHAVDRALLILSCACPEHEYETLASMSLGRRDEILIGVRRQSFGDCIDAWTACPGCQERLELSLSCESLLDKLSSQRIEDPGDSEAREHLALVSGYELRLRPPDSRDAALAAHCPTVDAAAELLFGRCVRLVSSAGPASVLPADARRDAVERLAAIDPGAEIRLDLSCPGCGQTWKELFDIVCIMWSEVCARAQRLLHEVHELARAYGWSEQAILSLSPARRAQYLQLVAP